MNSKARPLLPLLFLFSLLAAGAASSAADAPARRWVYVPSNLYVDDNLPKIEALLDRAAKAGYNGVLFADFKTMTWWKLDSPDRWRRNAQRLRKATRDRGLELIVAVCPFGRAEALLWHDPDLANGVPVKGAPMVARGGRLVPESTASVRNGSFEDVQGDKARGWGFQDDPGRGSFSDTQVVREGTRSLRFENVGQANPHGHGRISQTVAVRPWQQYRVRVWMKTERLNADMIQVLVVGGGRTLQYQFVSGPRGETREHHSGARNLTLDWTEQSVTFNSFTNTGVTVYVGVWGGRDGKIWWDDLRIEDAPLMNLVRRDALPLRVTTADGRELKEGRDFEPVHDSGMGARPWKGSFDTYHEPPVVALRPEAGLREGDRVTLDAFHTLIVYEGQVNCSMVEPKVFEFCESEIRHAVEAFDPDGFLLSHDEIRCAGWEPAETKGFAHAGALFAENMRRCAAIARKAGGGKPLYSWSDMFDPNHNAKKDYYLVNGDLAGSWEGLPGDLTVIKWGGGGIARPGLEFFAGRGHRQIIAAYYDSDPVRDHAMWTAASKGVPNVEGVIYTTWRNDYSQLEKFAGLWWGGVAKPSR